MILELHMQKLEKLSASDASSSFDSTSLVEAMLTLKNLHTRPLSAQVDIEGRFVPWLRDQLKRAARLDTAIHDEDISMISLRDNPRSERTHHNLARSETPEDQLLLNDRPEDEPEQPANNFQGFLVNYSQQGPRGQNDGQQQLVQQLQLLQQQHTVGHLQLLQQPHTVGHQLQLLQQPHTVGHLQLLQQPHTVGHLQLLQQPHTVGHHQMILPAKRPFSETAPGGHPGGRMVQRQTKRFLATAPARPQRYRRFQPRAVRDLRVKIRSNQAEYVRSEDRRSPAEVAVVRAQKTGPPAEVGSGAALQGGQEPSCALVLARRPTLCAREDYVVQQHNVSSRTRDTDRSSFAAREYEALRNMCCTSGGQAIALRNMCCGAQTQQTGPPAEVGGGALQGGQESAVLARRPSCADDVVVQQHIVLLARQRLEERSSFAARELYEAGALRNMLAVFLACVEQQAPTTARLHLTTAVATLGRGPPPVPVQKSCDHDVEVFFRERHPHRLINIRVVQASVGQHPASRLLLSSSPMRTKNPPKLSPIQKLLARENRGDYFHALQIKQTSDAELVGVARTFVNVIAHGRLESSPQSAQRDPPPRIGGILVRLSGEPGAGKTAVAAAAALELEKIFAQQDQHRLVWLSEPKEKQGEIEEAVIEKATKGLAAMFAGNYSKETEELDPTGPYELARRRLKRADAVFLDDSNIGTSTGKIILRAAFSWYKTELEKFKRGLRQTPVGLFLTSNVENSAAELGYCLFDASETFKTVRVLPTYPSRAAVDGDGVQEILIARSG